MSKWSSPLRLLLILTLLGGCAILRAKPLELLRELVFYQETKTCSSPKLDLVIFVRRPVENPEKDIWTKDIKMRVVLRGIDEILTITWDHKTEADPKTGEKYERTFNEFPGIEIIDENLDPVISPNFGRLRRALDAINPSRNIYTLKELRQLNYEIGSHYPQLVDICLYGFAD